MPRNRRRSNFEAPPEAREDPVPASQPDERIPPERQDPIRKRNAKFAERHRRNLGDRLGIKVSPLFPTVHISDHMSPIPISFRAQDALFEEFWSQLPRDVRTPGRNEPAIARTGFTVMAMYRFNSVWPGRTLFEIDPSLAQPLSGLWSQTVLEKALLKCVGRDQTENLFTVPVHMKIQDKEFSIQVIEGDFRYCDHTAAQPRWDPIPFGGIPVPQQWIRDSIRDYPAIVSKLSLRRSDLVNLAPIVDGVTLLEKAALVSIDEEGTIAWSRYEVPSDSVYFGSVFGFGRGYSIGTRLPQHEAKWTAPVDRRIATTQWIGMLIAPVSSRNQ